MTTGMQNFSEQTTTVHSETRLPFSIKAASQVITDWTICALCQNKTREKLQCPAKAKQISQGSTYHTLAENLIKFHEHGILSKCLINRLDDGEGVEETFRKRMACFHLSCRSKYNSTKLKRKSTESVSDNSDSDGEVFEKERKYTRRESGASVGSCDCECDLGICFLCESADRTNLRNCATFQLDEKLRRCALALQDTKLLAKLSAGDVIAQELKYHPTCLINLYRRAKPKLDCNDSVREQKLHGLVFAELTEYLQDARDTPKNRLTVFKLADLSSMYQTRLQEYGVECGRVHSGRLKTRLLAHFPDLQAHTSGRDVLFTFTEELNSTLKEAYRETFDDEAVHLAKAAKIVRRDMFAMKNNFNGTFDKECQKNSVPDTLLALMQMILNGPSIDQINTRSQASLSLAQIANFNSVQSEGMRGRKTARINHSTSRETPISVYIGMMLHAQTRKREIVECLHNLGISISYFRVLEISAELTRKACKQFQEDQVVCPMKLKSGLFTTAAIDNIDHNPSATTARDSFHGTAISLFQHPSENCAGTERTCTVQTEAVTTKGPTIPELPEFFTSIPPFVLKIPVQPPCLDHAPLCFGALVEVYNESTEAVNRDTIQVAQNLNETGTDIAVVGLHCEPAEADNRTTMAVTQNLDATATDLDAGDNQPDVTNTSVYDKAAAAQHHWMETVHLAELTDTGPVSWGAYHAAQQQGDHTPGISSLLPLFHEDSKSPAMIKHAMELVRNAVRFLNPEQTPVVTLDQPLFAIAKQIQWQCPEIYGENYMVLMLGGLHTEMAFLKTIGTLLRDSGWTDALVNANLATSGVAESFISASHVTRTRRAHQITVCALHKLMKKAYDQYLLQCTATEETTKYFDEWKLHMVQTSPTFHYWCMIMELQVLLLVFISSLREGDFRAYVESLTRIVPWFFSLDQQNYSRWLSVHIQDMKELLSGKSDCLPEFLNGHFVLQKTQRPFSRIALDQAHEQNNAIIKGDGGAVGLTENPSALRRWMLGGPEISRVIQEFETSLGSDSEHKNTQHHEQSKAVQENFKADVSKLADVIDHSGNPFLESGKDFVTLHDGNIVEHAVHESMKKLCAIGIEQYEQFRHERLTSRTKKISDPVKRNNMMMISGAKRRKKPEKSATIASLKSDCHLFSRLYIACQTRSGGLDDFFMYENQATPPSLSFEGKLRTTVKSGLLDCLEPLQSVSAKPEDIDVLIVDGAAIVNILRPTAARTFGAYAKDIFLPFMISRLHGVHRLDVVWDVYRSDSLKNCTRERRGQGKRKRVAPEILIAGQWSNFLRVDDNKTQLFNYLAQCLMTIVTNKLIITTQGPIALSNHPINHDGLSPCTHEEADSRIMVHLAHAAQNNTRISIRTVDTDVVVLAVSAAARHPDLDIFVEMGVGKDLRFIAAHQIASAIGADKALCLPIFHSLTGCDTVSSFHGIGKKTAWEVWNTFDDITSTFLKVSTPPCELTPDSIAQLERFTVLLYDRTSNCTDVNSARRHLFTKTGRPIDKIPPTGDALLQHFKRAVYQGGHIWGQAHVATPELPNPSAWGWVFVSENWQPLWTLLSQASSTCHELLKCACKKGCTNKRCKCNKAGLKCTALCKCTCECALMAN